MTERTPITTLKQFHEGVLKTESPIDDGIRRRMTMVAPAIRDILAQVSNLLTRLHADELKKFVFYGKDTDKNIVPKEKEFEYARRICEVAPSAGGKVLPDGKTRLLHGMLGLLTEAGPELCQAIFGNFYKELPNDPTNVMEECGDCAFYLVLILDALGFTLEQCCDLNQQKLENRYKDKKFTADEAINRNEESERAILEGTGAKPVDPLPGEVIPVLSAELFETSSDGRTFQVLQRCKDENGQLLQPGYYFWDEAGLVGGGPYRTEALALAGLANYAHHLNTEEPSDKPAPIKPVDDDEIVPPVAAKKKKQK